MKFKNKLCSALDHTSTAHPNLAFRHRPATRRFPALGKDMSSRALALARGMSSAALALARGMCLPAPWLWARA